VSNEMYGKHTVKILRTMLQGKTREIEKKEGEKMTKNAEPCKNCGSYYPFDCYDLGCKNIDCECDGCEAMRSIMEDEDYDEN
jgi:hypothetical protein